MYFMRNNHFFRKNLFVRFDFHCTHIWVIVKKSSPKNLSVDCRSTVGRHIEEEKAILVNVLHILDVYEAKTERKHSSLS